MQKPTEALDQPVEQATSKSRATKVRQFISGSAILALAVSLFLAVFAPLGDHVRNVPSAYEFFSFRGLISNAFQGVGFTFLGACGIALVGMACWAVIKLIMWLGSRYVGATEEAPTLDPAQPDIPAKAIFFVGTTGAGKSIFKEDLAKRMGLTSAEMEELLRPLPADMTADLQEDTDDAEAESRRLRAVREAIWANTPQDDPELFVLHDVLTALDLAEEPTVAQQKALFELLPASIIGQGIAWGFSDTEVRESIYSHAEGHLAKVAAAIQLLDEGS